MHEAETPNAAPRRLRGLMRFVLEAAFLVVVALGAALAHLGPWGIIAVMAVAWLLVAVVERTAAQDLAEVDIEEAVLPEPALEEAAPEPARERRGLLRRRPPAEAEAISPAPHVPQHVRLIPREDEHEVVPEPAAAVTTPPAPAAVEPEPAAPAVATPAPATHPVVAPVALEPTTPAEPAPSAPSAPAPVEAAPARPAMPTPAPPPSAPETPAPAPVAEAPAAPAAPAAEAPAAPAAPAAEPRAWNLWQLEQAARERAGHDVVKDEEWSFLLMYLREFASADGGLPVDFDALVRESFSDLIGAGR